MPKTKTERFPNGSVLSYPYLWRWQRNEGRFNAKDRPVCLLFSIADVKQDLTHLVILAISGTAPFEGQQALKIPPLEIHRAGLSTLKRGWITVDEYNYDIAERSYYFEPNQKPRGQLSPRFLEDIRQTFRSTLASHQARVDRTR